MGGPRSFRMYYIYILKSEKDLGTYVGYTDDPERRLHEHGSGQVRSTKNRRPLNLIPSENFQTSQEARSRERYWKNGGGKRKLKEIYEKDLAQSENCRGKKIPG